MTHVGEGRGGGSPPPQALLLPPSRRDFSHSFAASISTNVHNFGLKEQKCANLMRKIKNVHKNN